MKYSYWALMGVSILTITLCSGPLEPGDSKPVPINLQGSSILEVEDNRPSSQNHSSYSAQEISYFHQHGYTNLSIPSGHYPPRGLCRVWHPEQSPDLQPPPTQCSQTQVPEGAWLIRSPLHRPDYVHVVVYESHNPDTILSIGEFEIRTGNLIRLLM